MKHRIKKAVAKDKSVIITSPAVQKIKARKHIYDLFKDKVKTVKTRIHYEPLHVLKERPSLKKRAFQRDLQYVCLSSGTYG